MRLSQRLNFAKYFVLAHKSSQKVHASGTEKSATVGSKIGKFSANKSMYTEKKNNVVSATTTKKEVNYLTLLFDIFTHEPNYIQVTRQFAMNSDHSEHHIKQYGVHNCIFCTRTETDISCGRSLSAVYKTQGEKLKE